MSEAASNQQHHFEYPRQAESQHDFGDRARHELASGGHFHLEGMSLFFFELCTPHGSTYQGRDEHADPAFEKARDGPSGCAPGRLLEG